MNDTKLNIIFYYTMKKTGNFQITGELRERTFKIYFNKLDKVPPFYFY